MPRLLVSKQIIAVSISLQACVYLTLPRESPGNFPICLCGHQTIIMSRINTVRLFLTGGSCFFPAFRLSINRLGMDLAIQLPVRNQIILLLLKYSAFLNDVLRNFPSANRATAKKSGKLVWPSAKLLCCFSNQYGRFAGYSKRAHLSDAFIS